MMRSIERTALPGNQIEGRYRGTEKSCFLTVEKGVKMDETVSTERGSTKNEVASRWVEGNAAKATTRLTRGSPRVPSLNQRPQHSQLSTIQLSKDQRNLHICPQTRFATTSDRSQYPSPTPRNPTVPSCLDPCQAAKWLVPRRIPRATPANT